MITRLQGLLVEKVTPHVVLDVHGVGYEVDLPLNAFFQLPALGQPVTLWTHLSVREDAHQLFGFLDRDALQLFRILIKVSGVGPKLALAMLSGLEPDALRQAIANDNISLLIKVPGVGKRTAERLIVELHDKIGKIDNFRLVPERALVRGATTTVEPATPSEEAESALIALGYKPTEAARAVKAVSPDIHDTAELVRAALKGLMKL